jgi:glyceraldehyde-3-phosphate dehydrogenase/erythrose-4-phosphate dehydrogenase
MSELAAMPLVPMTMFGTIRVPETHRVVAIEAQTQRVAGRSQIRRPVQGVQGRDQRRGGEQPLKGALGFTDQPTSRSTSITMPLLHLPHGPDQNLVPSWCGNEWGFSNRMADIAVTMGELI